MERVCVSYPVNGVKKKLAAKWLIDEPPPIVGVQVADVLMREIIGNDQK